MSSPEASTVRTVKEKVKKKVEVKVGVKEKVKKEVKEQVQEDLLEDLKEKRCIYLMRRLIIRNSGTADPREAEV